jgi:hypothetical protein
MAKVNKVRGVKVFLTDAEASSLNRLLQYGVDYATRSALGLDTFSDELNVHASWTSFDFGTKASKDAPASEAIDL